MCSRIINISRPDAQLFEGQQEQQQQLNGELPDDVLRRQIINSLAKHVIFSKILLTLQLFSALPAFGSLHERSMLGHYYSHHI